MTSVNIPHPREEAIIIVKAAFENSNDIKTYHDDGVRVTGKTGASFGLIKSSYGEQIIVEIPEDQTSETETMVSVTGQKEVGLNIAANPEKYVSQVIRSINELKEKDIDVILEVLEENNVVNSGKEVSNVGDQADGSWLLIAIFVLILFFGVVMPMLRI